MKTIKWIWYALFLFVMIYSGYMYDRLPDRLAIHFNFHGEADGWGSKQSFFLFLLPLIVLMNVLFWGLLKWITKIPESMVNLTWKDYWFSTPARKAIAYQKLRLVLAIAAAMCNATFSFVFYMTCYVSLSPQYAMPYASWFIWIVLGGFTIFVVWTFYSLWPPKDDLAEYKKAKSAKQ